MSRCKPPNMQWNGIPIPIPVFSTGIHKHCQIVMELDRVRSKFLQFSCCWCFCIGRNNKGSRRVDRIRSNSMMISAISPNVKNMDCGLCRQRMSDFSVVAVLVCGHFYHVECLETRTSNEDRRDPPCPLCIPSGVNN